MGLGRGGARLVKKVGWGRLRRCRDSRRGGLWFLWAVQSVRG